MALQYTFLENDPLNSAVVTSAGEPAYTVSTPWRLVNRTTTVTVASGAVLATIEWHWFTPPIFVLRGEQVDMQQWLRRVSPFDLTTEYQGPDGNTYWWMRDIAFHKWRLIDHKSEFCVSESHPQRKNGFKVVEHMGLEIESIGAAFRDEIMLGFIIMEFKGRQDDNNKNKKADAP